MASIQTRLQNWTTMQLANDAERQRLEILRKAPAPNPPELLAATKCRVLKPFCGAGKRVEPGKIIELPKHDAQSLAAIGRVEIVPYAAD